MIIAPHKKRIGVLRGGPSPLYEVSLNTGRFILQNLRETDLYEPVDIFVSKDGVWHEYGYEKSPDKVLKKLDGVWNAMHGSYGEDGVVQKILEGIGASYTGSNALSSSVAMNKILTKRLFNKFGIKTPVFVSVNKDESMHSAVEKIFSGIPFPVVIKPASAGSSLGVSIANTKQEVANSLHKAFMYSPNVIVEEFIAGREVACGVIDDFRGENTYKLLPIEIVLPKNRTFYDFRAKYEDWGKEYFALGNLSQEEREKVKELAALVHNSMGLRHYSKSDFIVHPRRGVYVLEVNTLPPLGEKTSFIKSLESVGSNIKEFLHHTLDRALGKNHKFR